MNIGQNTIISLMVELQISQMMSIDEVFIWCIMVVVKGKILTNFIKFVFWTIVAPNYLYIKKMSTFIF